MEIIITSKEVIIIEMQILKEKKFYKFKINLKGG
jgi:hypothetical protein